MCYVLQCLSGRSLPNTLGPSHSVLILGGHQYYQFLSLPETFHAQISKCMYDLSPKKVATLYAFFCPLVFFHLACSLFFKNFISYFWLHWVFDAAHGLSLVAGSGSSSSSCCVGFFYCRARARGAWAQ